jgi:hypothetical protein
MASRREFLQASIAVSVLPLAASASEMAPPSLATPNFYKVIVDDRFAASVAFGAEMASRGASVTTIQGDITDFWFQDLSLAWQKEPLAIAGLTAHGPLFCLERLAWDHGMRVISRIPLEQDLYSWVIAPKSFLNS